MKEAGIDSECIVVDLQTPSTNIFIGQSLIHRAHKRRPHRGQQKSVCRPHACLSIPSKHISHRRRWAFSQCSLLGRHVNQTLWNEFNSQLNGVHFYAVIRFSLCFSVFFLLFFAFFHSAIVCAPFLLYLVAWSAKLCAHECVEQSNGLWIHMNLLFDLIYWIDPSHRYAT